MRVIETYLTELHDYPGGLRLPRCTLAEDDQGIRWLITSAIEIRADHWHRAATAGAVGVLTPAFGGSWLAVGSEQFAATRAERDGLYIVDYGQVFPEPPGVLALYASEREAPPPAPTGHGFVNLHTHTEFCLSPETRVVTAGMQWKPISEVYVGEELVGFDEDLRAPEGERGNSRSKMRRTTVIATKRVMRDCYRITLQDGTQIVASAQHGWVANGTARGSLIEPGGPNGGYGANTRRWITTDRLVPGKSALITWARPWEDLKPEQERDAAYLAGILDGEGWLSDGQLSIGQNPGVVWDEIQRVCANLGYKTTRPLHSLKGTCQTFRFQGYGTALQVISQCRPVRFLPRMDEVWTGRRSGGRNTPPILVVGLEHLGMQETVALTTTTKTFVAEGFLTHNSALDGLSLMREAVERVAAMGATAMGVTDHGICSGHPQFQAEAERAGVNPVFGIEAYFVDDVDDHSGGQFAYWHLILLAQNDAGLKNLWAASTEAERRGKYGKYARMDWEMLARHSEGLIATTACLRGPVSSAITDGDTLTAQARLARLAEVFSGRLYAEIHATTTEEQAKVNTELVRLARAAGVPLIGAADSHYVNRADARRHAVWMACQTGSAVGDDTGMFNHGASYHLHDEPEMRAALDYLPREAVDELLANTVIIGQQAEARITTAKTLPVYARRGAADDDVQALRKLAQAGWGRIADRPDAEAYRERFDREMGLIERQSFAGYFLIVADYVRWAKANKILVGPGRGSGGGCLVAYLTGITELDPVRWDLSFERFLTEGRTSLPDFDVDFPMSKKTEIMAYLRQRWGDEHVVTIGTHTRLKSKAVLVELARAMRDRLPMQAFKDLKDLSDFITEAEAGTAGLGLSWEDLWAQHAEKLDPVRARYPELFGYADGMVGLLKSYGRHAAGVIISTGEPLTGALPLRSVKDEEQMVTQVDAHAVEDLGHVKFDILMLRTLDTVQGSLDAIEARTGHRIDLYGFDGELEDPEVWEMICSGHLLGLFQIETQLGVQLVRRMRPRSLPELADVITLVRPGPRNSGLTESYLRRREGAEEVSYPDPRLEEVLRSTWGATIYQEQILKICRLIAGYDDVEADDVRKILGKKQVEKIDAAGRDFIARAVDGGMPRVDAEVLWSQMAEFSKYSFGKAHAYAYALLAYWTAFLKVHFPVEFIAAALSTVDKDRIPVFVREARRIGVPVLPPDVNASKLGFTPDAGAVRYGLDSLKGIGDGAAAELIAAQPYTSVADCAERTGRAVTSGTIRILARVGAFDTLEPHRAALVARLEAEASGTSKRCVFKVDGLGEDVLPCGYDWATEPPRINERTGKKLPPKPEPKRCTTACRQYTAPAPVDAALIAPYTPEQIGDIELEALGLYLSYTPFDRISAEHRAWCRDAAEDAASGIGGEHTTVALVDRVKPFTARSGAAMGFINLTTEGPDLDTVVFSKVWESLEHPARLVGRLVLATVIRTDKGLNLASIEEL